jgi:D-alanyl-D-alanine carboxypeptidase (penicillin-binding protein 5/6)
MGGTQVFLKAGEVHTLDEIMHAIAIASANDAAMALAESLWGSKEDCLKRMNERAAELGMLNTKYNSVHGLPPTNGEDFDQTTARDIVLLARECVKSEHIRTWVSQKEFTFRPGEAAKANTNKLLWRMADCDGLKTGYIRAAKFCVAATAERGGLRLISVVLGHPNKYERFNLAERLIEEGFQQICKVRAATKGETVVAKASVRDAATTVETLEAVISDDLYVIVNKHEVELLELVPEVDPQLAAPIHKGDELGSLVVQLSGVPIGQTTLLSSVDVEADTLTKLWRGSDADTAAAGDSSWSSRAWKSVRSIFSD